MTTLRAPCPRGIYLLVDPDVLDPARWSEVLPQVLRAGLALVQLRAKNCDARTKTQLAHKLQNLCAVNATPLLINDDVDLATRIGAQGVHLGQGDGSVAEARDRLGAHALIGRTCHNSMDLVRDAITDGADYVSIGAMFPSPTKPHAISADIRTLSKVAKASAVPVCAIGGIGLQQLPQVTKAGASLVAVCSAVLSANLPGEVAGHLVRLFADEFKHYAI